MTTMDICCPKQPPRIRAFFGAFLQRLRSQRRQRHDVRHVEELGDHILRDIGLERADIREALQHGRPHG